MRRASTPPGDSPSCPTAVPWSPSGRAACASCHPPAPCREPISGVPAVVASGQGGLLDVAIDPEFVTNQVYLSYAEAGPGGVGTAVARGTLTGTTLENVQVIWRQVPKVSGEITSGRDSSLRATARCSSPPVSVSSIATAPRASPTPSARSSASTPTAPFRPTTRSWTARVRSPRSGPTAIATCRAPRSIRRPGQLWTIEHGAQGGDELNLDLAGKNYGWPVITWGMDYSATKIGEGTTKAGMEQPVYYWVPSIAPSGLLYYTGDAFPQWRGSFFVGALKWQGLVTHHGRPRRHREGRALPGQAGQAPDPGCPAGSRRRALPARRLERRGNSALYLLPP